ncbi:MAG TPA: PilZ domain-containing protein [bacterium]|nr:PilZ domain-containing protein [bacterium]
MNSTVTISKKTVANHLKRIKRREYKRIEKPYIARLRIKQYKGLGKPSAEWDMVTVKDLSAGGMRFNYNKNLGLGSLLDFKIDISKSTSTINCVGKVTRAEQFQSTSMFCTAIKFINIRKKEKETINTTVQELLEYKSTHF